LNFEFIQSRSLYNSSQAKCYEGTCFSQLNFEDLLLEKSEQFLFRKLEYNDSKVYRCGRSFDDLDFCLDDGNVLNLASAHSIIGEVDFVNVNLVYDWAKEINIRNITSRMCEVTKDCYDLISHWNLRDSFRSDLQMTCTSDGYCKSRNKQLWTRGTLLGENFCQQELEMENIFDITEPGPSRNHRFKRCQSGPSGEQCYATVLISVSSASAGAVAVLKATPFALTSEISNSACRFCPFAFASQCPPLK